MKREQIVYIIIGIVVLCVMTIGVTYAYFTSSVESDSNSVSTGSTAYSISLQIIPIYDGYSFIPMDDDYILKALKNEANPCHDKYDRGVCSLYKLHIYDYSSDLRYISGYMDIISDNMENLSYVVLEPVLDSEYVEDRCLKLEGGSYCISVDATHMGSVSDDGHLSLGDGYDVLGKNNTDLLLAIWLTNLDYSQNDVDIGSFHASVTINAGNGGEIKGSIASMIKVDLDSYLNMDEGVDNNGE